MMSTFDLKNNENLSTQRVDLHSHSHFSDGSLSPKALVERAVNKQVNVLAITDHDTVAGLDEAKQTIAEQNLPLTLIDGIEISTLWQGFEIHIVGLRVDVNNQDLKQLIVEQQQRREQRAVMIGDKLAKCGFADVYQQAKLLADKGSITRAHFAKVLMAQGLISTIQQAFDKYIGKGKRAYVKPQWCTIEQAIVAIHQAGGVAVIAHPIRYDLSTKWLRRLISDFQLANGDGLEIVLPQMNNQQQQLMLSLAQEYQLYASMGSDFHHPSRWSELGRHLTMPAQATPIWQKW